MRRFLAAVALLAVVGSAAHARGILIPVEKKLPPMRLIDQKVTIAIEDQVAVTQVEQTFRNSTPGPLEAIYIFPVPKGASVRKFSMWINGKEETGEIVEAPKARQIYTDIVSRTRDPGLLEYIQNDLIRLRVFPVPAKGDQKITLSYTSVAEADNGLISYMYPMRADGNALQSIEKLAINITLKSQHALTNIYSPSHPITIQRSSDKEAIIGFEKNTVMLDRDFQLFYQAGSKDIGLTAVTHRPTADQKGYFMTLLSPRAELAKVQQVPRDFVYVIDTSGSMRGRRLTQAKAALKYCLRNLTPMDRFTMIHFASTVHKYTESLQDATPANLESARRWVDDLEATGGTAIDDALRTALAMRSADQSRTYTMVFFTDGQPTFGEKDPAKILENVKRNNTGNTRIFSFGVGDDVNTVLLDALADNTKAVSTYVRESEDIEAKVSSLYAKISNPVLANLKLTVGEGVALTEVYPPQLPDLFRGSQLVVFGRYTGKGSTAIKLEGTIGSEKKEFVYDIRFPESTTNDRRFVEDLWARRKVGYLLDQIRVQGESKEVVDEVVMLAKKYGIATPYTSYLYVPDSVMPAHRAGGMGMMGMPGGGMMGMQGGMMGGGMMGMGGFQPNALMPAGGGPQKAVADFAKGLDRGVADGRTKQEIEQLRKEAKKGAKDGKAEDAEKALQERRSLDAAGSAFRGGALHRAQQGQVGVDFAVMNNALRFQNQTTRTASRNVQSRNLVDVGGVWIDDGFTPKLETVNVKAMSPAYFRILEKHPEAKDVFTLGNYLVWVTPSGQALIVDEHAGVEELADTEIDRLFVAAKK